MQAAKYDWSMSNSVLTIKLSATMPTPQETAALGKGGLHRLFMGNVSSGAHTMQAVITAYDSAGKDFQRTVNYSFSKNSLRKIVEIKAGDDNSKVQPALFNFREWESKN